jgi:hypothetical protein
MKFKTWILAWASAGLLLTQTGCAVLLVGAAIGLGAGTMAYTKGDLETLEPVSYDAAWTAVEDTAKEMSFTILKQDKKALEGKLVCKSHYGEVTFALESKGERITRITIRVGTFGDEPVSRRIYEKLKSKLK